MNSMETKDLAMKNQVVEAIHSRRSVRKFTDQPVSDDDLNTIIEAGTWAPSGTNNQPWRFVIVRDQAKKNELGGFTHYGKIMEKAAVCIVVFADRNVCYHEIKDSQAVGACIQNMLLTIHSLGLGAVWLGEIYKNGDKVRMAVELPENYHFHAVVALGHPYHEKQTSDRQPLDQVVVGRF